MRQKGKGFSIIRSFILLTLFIASSTLVGCDFTGGLSGTVQETTNKTVAVLDEAINSLNNQSADWQSVLQQAQSKLTEAAQSTVRNEISNSMQRAVQATGTQIRCIIDMLHTRLQEDLRRIKAKLLHQPVSPPTPNLCSVVPSAIDMSLDPTRRNLIILDGYNFDTTPSIQAFLVNSNQSGEVDVSSYIDVQTHYQMSLNLGSNGIPITSTSQRLILRWQGQQLSSIPVIRSTPQCQKTTVRFTPNPHTYIPPLVSGDAEFHGNGPSISVNIVPIVTRSSIQLQVTMTAQETGGHATRADGTETYTLWSAPPGEAIVFVSNAMSTSFSYTDTNTQEDIFSVGVGYVSQLRFVGDTMSSLDAGVQTRVTIVFTQLTIELKQTTNCSNTP